jgi:hypothetical protein
MPVGGRGPKAGEITIDQASGELMVESIDLQRVRPPTGSGPVDAMVLVRLPD